MHDWLPLIEEGCTLLVGAGCDPTRQDVCHPSSGAMRLFLGESILGVEYSSVCLENRSEASVAAAE